MTFLVWVMIIVDVYLGSRCLLNAVGVLRTSKYGKGTTVLFACLYLGFAAACIWSVTVAGHPGLGLLLAFGPWVLGIALLCLQLIVGRHP